jgi:hypothetical protein
LLLALVFLFAAVFRLAVLNRPFAYDPEGSSGALNGVLARNYLRFDLASTHGMPVLTVGPRGATPIAFYSDHPPLVPLLIVPFYAAFGVGEWQTRAPIALITLGAIGVLYLLLASAGRRRGALLAAAAFATVPMTLYFGGFPDVMGMPLVLGVLLATLAYLRFHRAPDGRRLIGVIAAFTFAALCDWPAFVLVPVFTTHFVATRPRGEWAWVLGFGGAACALFAAVYVYIGVATGLPWNWMAPLFLRHSALGASRFTVHQWIAAAWRLNRVYHTLPLLAAAGLWLVTSGLRVGDSRAGVPVVRLLMAWGVLCVAIGIKAVYNHPWDWLLLTPGLVAAAGLVVDDGLRIAEHRVPAKIAGASAGVCLVFFASWTAHSTYRMLYPVANRGSFTPMQMGEAIRRAAPDPRSGVLIVGGDEADSQLWFYGDRALKLRVWTVNEFERRLHDSTVDLVYDFEVQPQGPVAAGLVFPARRRETFASLWTYLEQRYRRVPLPSSLADDLEVFDLTARK